MTPDIVSVTLRALGFIALFQAAGAVLFLTLFGGQLTRSASAIRRLTLLAASGGVLLVLAHLSLDAARMADEFAGLWDGDLQRRAWISTNGAAHVVQVVGMLGILVGLRRASNLILATMGAVLTVLALLLTGHTSINTMRWLLAPLLAVHLLIIAFWFGALVPLYLVSQREPIATAGRVIALFSAVAGWLVPCIALAGFGIALVLLPDLSALRRPYGLSLLGKAIGFSALMVLAAFNKWRLTPALSLGTAGALPTLRRSIAIEWVLIASILTMTAALTSLFSPEY
jgi:putative copper export protein